MQFILFILIVIPLVSPQDIEAAIELAPIGLAENLTQEPSRLGTVIPEAHTIMIQEATPLTDFVTPQSDQETLQHWYRSLAVMGSIVLITIALGALLFH